MKHEIIFESDRIDFVKLSEKEIDALFDGVTYLYKNIKIETLDPELKI